MQVRRCLRRQKKLQPDKSRPGMTTMMKKAQLTRVKVIMKSFPRPGYSLTYIL